jgi:hypothetical protein
VDGGCAAFARVNKLSSDSEADTAENNAVLKRAKCAHKKWMPKEGSSSVEVGAELGKELEEFEKKLSTPQKDEIKAKEDYDPFAAAKADSIDTGKAKLNAMEYEDVGNVKALSVAESLGNMPEAGLCQQGEISRNRGCGDHHQRGILRPTICMMLGTTPRVTKQQWTKCLEGILHKGSTRTIRKRTHRTDAGSRSKDGGIGRIDEETG